MEPAFCKDTQSRVRADGGCCSCEANVGEVCRWSQLSHYKQLCDWYANPANAERAAEIERNYVEAMQRDPHLD
jgi:hypothetical protein